HGPAHVAGGDRGVGDVAADLDGPVAGVHLGAVTGGDRPVARDDVVVEVLVDVAEGGDVLVDRVVDRRVPVVDERRVVVLEPLVRDVDDVRVVAQLLHDLLDRVAARVDRRGRRHRPGLGRDGGRRPAARTGAPGTAAGPRRPVGRAQRRGRPLREGRAHAGHGGEDVLGGQALGGVLRQVAAGVVLERLSLGLVAEQVEEEVDHAHLALLSLRASARSGGRGDNVRNGPRPGIGDHPVVTPSVPGAGARAHRVARGLPGRAGAPASRRGTGLAAVGDVGPVRGARSEGLDAGVLRRGLDAGVDVDDVVVAGVRVAVVHRVVAVVELGVERVGRVEAVVDRVVRVLDLGVEAVGDRVVGDTGLGGAVVGDLDGARVALDRDVAGAGVGAVAEGHGRAVLGADGDVVGLDGAVADDRLAEHRVLDLGEVAVALV